jgi:hypothetical protein
VVKQPSLKKDAKGREIVEKPKPGSKVKFERDINGAVRTQKRFSVFSDLGFQTRDDSFSSEFVIEKVPRKIAE